MCNLAPNIVVLVETNAELVLLVSKANARFSFVDQALSGAEKIASRSTVTKTIVENAIMPVPPVTSAPLEFVSVTPANTNNARVAVWIWQKARDIVELVA